ncbi:hypothetical protein GCM10025867_50120 (plasmid) [Frondihabitans sucicola]|uniref:Uncharacterized protein n=1 Tax=Frondihabitans sucicola TaxID=1268041 RepID=A0ABN6Y9U9_9MICO|nr:hypothetical protein [Frondihabitans sucicola]BDZ52771.1 hypothetical protein GCM10025867_50120 [Frondihabitans sucicola]
MTFITFQQESDASGKRPWPMHIAEDGAVGNQRAYQGDPIALIGFQADVDVQHVDLLNKDFQADPQLAVGMYPVFQETGKGFYADIRKVVSATVVEQDFAAIAN